MHVLSSEPLVSIGIPTYNRAKNGNLRRVVERSLGQSYSNIEVIVSDNCSDDNTSDVMAEFSDSRLQYFRQNTNIGPNSNFNFCLDQARGKYFLLFHDDDSIDPDFIETCMASLEEGKDVGIIFTGVRVIDQNDNILKEHQNNAGNLSASHFMFGWFHGKFALFLCNTLYNTELLKGVGGFHSKHNLYDDLVATFSLVGKYERVDVPEIKASFRRHSSNRGSFIAINKWIDDGAYLLTVLKKIFPDQADTITEIGGRYFTKKIYLKCSRQHFFQRWANYLRAFSAYNYRFSPFRYEYRNSIHPKIVNILRSTGFGKT